MFWINAADRPTIETATMSGLNRQTIVSTGLRKPGKFAMDDGSVLVLLRKPH